MDRVILEPESEGGKFVTVMPVINRGEFFSIDGSDEEGYSSVKLFKTYCWPAKGGRVVFRAAEIDGNIFVKDLRFEHEVL